MKRKIIFISFLVFLIVFGYLYTVKIFYPEKQIISDRGIIYDFNSPFLRTSSLRIKPIKKINYLEIYFSNERIVRYYDENFDIHQLEHLSRWKDRTGRIRVFPIVNIKTSLSFKEIFLNLGKDYLRFCGSITQGEKIIKILLSSDAQTIFVKNCFFSKTSKYQAKMFIEKKGSFHLKKLDHPAVLKDGHVQIWEYLYPSHDGQYIALASYDHSIYFLDAKTGSVIWKFHMPDGMGSFVEISSDNQYVVTSEHSVEGNLYCLNGQTGELIWKYSTSKDVGSIHDSLPYPGMWSNIVKPKVAECFIADDKTVVTRVFRTRVVKENGKRKNISIGKIYAFDLKSGQLKWSYPDKGNLKHLRTSRLRISKDGQLVSFALFNWEKVNPTVYVCDINSGKKIWQYTTDTDLKYFKKASAYCGLEFSYDGKYAVLAQNDGRIFVFNNENGELIRILNIAPPIEAGSIPVMTYIAHTEFIKGNELIVVTGNTYTTPYAETSTPPLFHPHANSVFCYDMKGDLKWRYTCGGSASDIDVVSFGEKNYMCLSQAHNVQTGDIREHGVYVFDLNMEGGGFSRIKAFYHTDGICVSAKFSKNLKKLFIIEAVIDMDRSNKADFQGQHAIHFFKLKDT